MGRTTLLHHCVTDEKMKNNHVPIWLEIVQHVLSVYGKFGELDQFFSMNDCEFHALSTLC